MSIVEIYEQTSTTEYGASVGTSMTHFAKRVGFLVVGIVDSSSDYAKSFGEDVIVNYRGARRDVYVDICAHFPILNTRSHGSHSHLCLIKITAFGSHPDSVAYNAVKVKGSTLLFSRVPAKATPAGNEGLEVSLALNLSEV